MTGSPATSPSRIASLRSSSYFQSSFGVLFFFCALGIWWPFFQRWLTSLGLNGMQIGTVYSLNSLIALVMVLTYGVVQDKLGMKRTLILIVSTIAALIGPFVQFIYAPLITHNLILGTIIGSLVLCAGYLSAISLVEAVTERYSRHFGFEYGQSRAWGSLGYAIAVLLAGITFNINPFINFWIASLFGVAMLLVYAVWYTPEQRAERSEESLSDSLPKAPSLREMARVLLMPSLWSMIIFVMLTCTFYTVFDQQFFPSFYTSLFPQESVGNTAYGILNSAHVFAESIMMGTVPVLMKRIGVRKAMLLGACVLCFRITLCALFTDPVIVSAARMLYAIDYPLLALSIFRYFTLHFNPRISATLYMVGFQISAQIGQVIAATPLGIAHDVIGDRATFFIIAGVIVAAIAYGFFVIKRDDQQVDGEPLITVQG